MLLLTANGNGSAGRYGQMPQAKLDTDTSIYYHDSGSGDPPVVFLHGFPFSSALWDPQVAALKHRYRVISPDLRGFGRSPIAAEPYSIVRLADDIADLLDHLKLAEVVIVGLSMGGYVALEFYRRHRDRVLALVLADTRPAPDTPEAKEGRVKMAKLAQESGSAAVTKQLIPQLLAPDTPATQPHVVERLRIMMEAQQPEAITAALQAMAERADSRPLLHTIDVPVLVVAGSEDVITPPAETREWAKSIPSARVRLIEQAGHVSNLEQPAAFNQLLLGFLDALQAEPTRLGRGHR